MAGTTARGSRYWFPLAAAERDDDGAAASLLAQRGVLGCECRGRVELLLKAALFGSAFTKVGACLGEAVAFAASCARRGARGSTPRPSGPIDQAH